MMAVPPTRLTDAERNHLDHHYWESSKLEVGPATEWNVANGIMPHELLPLANLRAEETHRDRQEYPFEPQEPWIPPADNADAFRARIKEVTEAQSGR